MRYIDVFGYYGGVLRNLRLYGRFKVLKLASIGMYARSDATETKARVCGQLESRRDERSDP